MLWMLWSLIWALFWDHFGIILGPFWDYFGAILGLFWDHFGHYFGAILGFWGPLLRKTRLLNKALEKTYLYSFGLNREYSRIYVLFGLDREYKRSPDVEKRKNVCRSTV